jgi:hypothetical protein
LGQPICLSRILIPMPFSISFAHSVSFYLIFLQLISKFFILTSCLKISFLILSLLVFPSVCPKNFISIVKFKSPPLGTKKSTAFWNVTLSGLIETYHHLEYCHLL